MKTSDRVEFFTLLQGVYDLYGRDLSEMVGEIWWEACGPFDLVAVRDAMNRHVVNPDNGQFLPKPADLVKLIGGGTMDAAMVAWSKVDRAVRSIGPYQTVVFDDPIIMAVLRDMGGWIGFGQYDDDEWPFKAKEFQNRYRGYRIRGHIDGVPNKLIGITDAENSPAGHSEMEPILIGRRTEAEKILLSTQKQIEGPERAA